MESKLVTAKSVENIWAKTICKVWCLFRRSIIGHPSSSTPANIAFSYLQPSFWTLPICPTKWCYHYHVLPKRCIESGWCGVLLLHHAYFFCAFLAHLTTATCVTSLQCPYMENNKQNIYFFCHSSEMVKIIAIKCNTLDAVCLKQTTSISKIVDNFTFGYHLDLTTRLEVHASKYIFYIYRVNCVSVCV